MRIYKIWDKVNKKYCSAYSRACHDEVEWLSEEDARNAHCAYNWKDKSQYECHSFERHDRRVS